MMMQSELLLPPWSPLQAILSTDDHTRLYDPKTDFCTDEFSPSFTTPEDLSLMSCLQTLFSDDPFDQQNLGDEDLIPSPIGGSDIISDTEIEEMCRSLKGSDSEESFSSSFLMEGNEWSPCLSPESRDNTMLFSSLPITLRGDMDVDNRLIILHLLRAYGEAIVNREKELAEVIVKSINEKSSPMGEAIDRVAFNLFQSRENQGDYISQESSKNFMEGFKVIHQSLPFGMFAHNTANSAILEAMPDYTDIVHIVDFDIGEGIQWPPLIEAMSKRKKALKFTSVKLEDGCTTSFSSFEMTKKLLQEYARQCGLQLQVEEKSMEEMASELTSMKKRRRGKVWLAFNCMIVLPHMARRRRRSDVMHFLATAKELLANYGASGGIVTFGDGEGWDVQSISSDYASFFDALLKHYQAAFESLEQNFPSYLAEARMALESLFLAPKMCPLAWYRDWEEMVGVSDLGGEDWLKAWKFSLESVTEAKQIVNERNTSYKVKIDVKREDEMVLEWKGTPLVRVSAWTS